MGVCKASRINFSVMWSTNIDMFLITLHNSKEISSDGTHKASDYFKLDDATMKLVDDKAEEIFLTKRFFSLSSYKLHYDSKQELKNNMARVTITTQETFHQS